MTLNQFRLTNLSLEDHFGPVVASISEDLKWGPKTLKLLSVNSNLPMSTVKHALNILINFDFVSFKASAVGNSCEYFLQPDNILHFLRYPRFISIIGKKYGKEAEFTIRELLFSGKMTLYRLILKVTYNLSSDYPEIPYSLSTIKNIVCDLIENNFIIPVDRVTGDAIPVPVKITEHNKDPMIDMAKLSGLYNGSETEFPKNECYWKVNFERFVVEYRNNILIAAARKRFGEPSGVVMRNLLKLSYVKNDPWRPFSHPISMMLLNDSIGNDTSDTIMPQFVKKYLDEMEDDTSSFVGHSPDHSGGTVVCFKDAFRSLTIECLQLIIDQKFGSKAARVFNIIRDKKFIEVEQIQRIAMLADKEAKNITYKLLEENFIQMQELRKPTTGLAGASGPNKSFILFYVDLDMVIEMIINMAFKSIYNMAVRLREERVKYSHIIEKKKQADFVTIALKEQKANEEQISEMIKNILSPPEMTQLESLQKMTKKLQLAQLQIDETIILLQLYMQYNKLSVPEGKLRKRK